jgi:hypothetical protein
VAVSLSARDRQALDLIAEDLAASDPRFAAKLSAFSKLTDGGEMPARERILAGRPAPIRGLLVRDSRSEGRTRPRRPLYLVTLVIWLVISVALISVALVLSHSGTAAACARGGATGCAKANRPVPSAPRLPVGQNGLYGQYGETSQSNQNALINQINQINRNAHNSQYGAGFLGP